VTSRKPLKSMSQGSIVHAVKFNEIRIASGGSDGKIKVWDTSSGGAVHTLTHASGPAVRCLLFDESKLIAGGDDRTVKVWDVRSGNHEVTLTGHGSPVENIEYISQNKVYSCGRDAVKMFDMRNNGSVLYTLTGGAVNCFQVLESVNKVVTGEQDGSVRVWNSNNGTLFHHFRGNSTAQSINSIQADGELVVSACADGLLRVYDMKRRLHKHNLKDHTAAVNMCQFDGHKIVSGGADHCLKVWNVKDGKRLYSLLGGTLQARSNDPPHPSRPGCSSMKFDDGRIVGAFNSLLRVYSFTGEDVNQGK